MKTIAELQAQSNEALLAQGYRWWNGTLILVSPAQLVEIADGEVLTCIDGTTAVKGKDYIDDDTRAGMLAYGFMSLNPKDESE